MNASRAPGSPSTRVRERYEPNHSSPEPSPPAESVATAEISTAHDVAASLR